MARVADETFGQAVRRLRKARDLTQKQLADALGCNRITIYNIESGLTKTPYWQTVKSIADYFGIEPDSLGILDSPVPRQRKFPS